MGARPLLKREGRSSIFCKGDVLGKSVARTSSFDDQFRESLRCSSSNAMVPARRGSFHTAKIGDNKPEAKEAQPKKAKRRSQQYKLDDLSISQHSKSSRSLKRSNRLQLSARGMKLKNESVDESSIYANGLIQGSSRHEKNERVSFKKKQEQKENSTRPGFLHKPSSSCTKQQKDFVWKKGPNNRYVKVFATSKKTPKDELSNSHHSSSSSRRSRKSTLSGSDKFCKLILEIFLEDVGLTEKLTASIPSSTRNKCRFGASRTKAIVKPGPSNARARCFR